MPDTVTFTGKSNDLCDQTGPVLADLEGKLRPVRRTPAYALALTVTAVLMILIPVLYFSLTILIGYGVFLYVVYAGNVILFGIGGGIVRLVAYVAPPFAGVTMMFFMFKPILVRQQKIDLGEPVEVDEGEPFIEYVRNIARAVRAPLPSRVVIDANVNASASFAPGVFNFLRRRLVLTVGLPLLRSMNTREVAGILAHEFGHFSQGLGMYFSFIIRSVNIWLQRVVYERDAWDIRLERSAKLKSWAAAIVFNLARGMVWLNRRVLWCFMMLGHMISFYLLRQMEFDADQYESQVAGSDQFAKISNHAVCLSVAWQESVYWAANAWNDRKLPDDFGYLVSCCEQDLDPEARKNIITSANRQESSLWSTHPSNSARIQAVEKRPTHGAYLVEANCARLFGDFEALSRDCSRLYYKSVLGDEVVNAMYLNSADFVTESRVKRESHVAFVRFFGDVTGILTPLGFSPPDKSLSPNERPTLVAEIKEARETIGSTMDKIKEASRNYDLTFAALLNALRGKAVLEAGFAIKEGQFGFKGTTLVDASNAVKRGREMLQIDYSRLLTLRDPIRKRLELGLKLALSTNKELETMVKVGAALPNAETSVRKTAEADIAAHFLLVQDAEPGSQHMLTIGEYCRAMHESFDETCRKLDEIPYPFPEEIGTSSIGALMKGHGVDSKAGHAEFVTYVNSRQSILSELYCRVMGRLALAVETEEKAVGLEPIAIPVSEQDEE